MNDSVDDGAVSVRARPAPGPAEEEHIIWSSTKGHVSKLHVYTFATAIAVLLILYAPWPWIGLALVPLAIAGLYALAVQCTRYELTTERIRRRSGVLIRRTEEVELYRVEDTAPVAPLVYRLFGRGNVDVLSTDLTAERLPLIAIQDHEKIRNTIRDRVEAMRKAKGVRLVE